jgi:hypothetical protein
LGRSLGARHINDFDWIGVAGILGGKMKNPASCEAGLFKGIVSKRN